MIENLVEVLLDEPDSFLKIKETLSRIGVASKKDKKLYQSAHLLHKRGKYYIVHFLELFLLDGKTSTFSDEDRRRRNSIAKLLHDWGLCKVVDINMIADQAPMSAIKVLPFKEKNSWTLIQKYSIGSKS